MAVNLFNVRKSGALISLPTGNLFGEKDLFLCLFLNLFVLNKLVGYILEAVILWHI